MIVVSRPLRFLASVTGGWVVLRIVLLWPDIHSVGDAAHAVIPVAVAQVAPQSPKVPAPAEAHRRAPVVAVLRSIVRPASRQIPASPRRHADPTRVALALLGLMRFGSARGPEPGLVAGLPGPALPGPHVDRFSGSAWLVARGGSGAGQGLTGGQLGGSQAGVRLAYALDRHVALAVRFSSPLAANGRELAVGVEWRPTRLPVRLVAEQRVALDRGRGGTVAGVVGGFGPAPLVRRLNAEGYGQAGVIARGGGEGFADGALRVSQNLATLDRVRFDLGAGAWGGAQRGAARLDLGPSLSARLPIGGAATRLSLDWRQRVAGQARPGSGLVVTLGSDF